MPGTVLIQSFGIGKKKACLKPDAVLILYSLSQPLPSSYSKSYKV